MKISKFLSVLLVIFVSSAFVFAGCDLFGGGGGSGDSEGDGGGGGNGGSGGDNGGGGGVSIPTPIHLWTMDQEDTITNDEYLVERAGIADTGSRAANALAVASTSDANSFIVDTTDKIVGTASFDFVQFNYLREDPDSGQELDFTTDFTLEMYIKLDTLPSTVEGGRDIQLFRRSSSGTGYRLFIERDNPGNEDKVRFRWADTTEGDTTINSDSALSVNTWYHIVVTVGVGGNATMYINGAAQADTATVNGIVPGGDTEKVIVGGDSTSETPGRTLDGHMDEVAIYDVILSQAQITARANLIP